jgi:hypothetical protein
MPYSQFTSISDTLKTLGLTLKEKKFFPDDMKPIEPSETIAAYLELMIPPSRIGSEKNRSEGIITPILAEARRIQAVCERPISIFSGEDFNVEPSLGLNGVCDFLICRSPLMSIITAPVVAIVEAKKHDLDAGVAQCMAEMVAASTFNERSGEKIAIVYGIVTTAINWRFLELDGCYLTYDISTYNLEPISDILAKIVWLVRA